SHVDDVVVAYAEGRTEFLEDGNLSPTRRRAHNRVNLPGCFVIAKTRTEDVIGSHNALECRLDNLLRRGGNHVERNLVAVRDAVERTREEVHVVLQPDALPGFDQVFLAYSTEVRIVQDKVRKFRALLDEVHLRKALHLVVEGV